MATKKQLFKSKTNRKLSGVFGGLGDYFEIDPTLLRISWIAIVIFTGFAPGIIAYIVASLVVPEK